MELVILHTDIEVFFITANSFPDGILEAHQKLHASIPFSRERRYFGISRPEEGIVIYKAAVEKLKNDKADQFNCGTCIIEKGKYRCITILNYHMEPQNIGKAFGKLTLSSDIDPNGYCVEWYFNDEDVKCMVKLKD